MTLPTGWTTAKLGEVTLERVAQGEPGTSAVPYIDIGSIDRALKRVGPTDKVTRTSAPTRARQWVKSGDVLVSLTRPNLNAVALVSPELDGAVASTGFDVLRSTGILPEWIFNRVRSQTFVSDVCQDVQGVVYPAIRPADVRRHELPIPPAAEQRRIVEAIDSYLTRLDDAVASLERVHARLMAYRASLLKAAVAGRLVPTEASLARAEKRVYEPAGVLLARILKERRRLWEEAELAKFKAAGRTPRDDKWKASYEEPMAPSSGKLPRLPEGWCWASVSQVAPLQPGYAFPSTGFQSVGVRLLKGRNVRDGWIAVDEIDHWPESDTAHLDQYRLSEGDVVLAMDRPVYSSGTKGTKVAMLDASWGRSLLLQRVGCFRRASAIDPHYLYLFASGGAFREHIIGKQKGSQDGKDLPHVSAETVDSCPFPLPPWAEQFRISEEAERLLSVGSAAEHESENSLKRCRRLRQSVLKWAFEGNLVDQDPTDEPAEKLLARIRAERATVPIKKTRGRTAKGAA